MTLTRRLQERRVLTSMPWSTEDPSRIPRPSQAGGYGRSAAGVRVDEDTALAHIPVFACQSLIADAISMLPWDRFRDTVINGRTVPIRLQKPLILSDPSPASGDVTEIKGQTMASLLSNGNAYNTVGAVGRDGIPRVVTPTPSSKVRKVSRDSSGRRIYDLDDGTTLVHWADLSPSQRASGDSMLHWRGFTRPGSLTGVSPIAAGMQGIGLSIAAEKFGASWFGEGAIPPAVLKNVADDELTDDEAKDLQRKWVEARRSRFPAVLPNQSLEFEVMEISPEESQFIESRKLSALDIAQLYRVPPHMVGLVDRATSWGSGIEEQGIGFVTYTLGPWIQRYEAAMSSLLPAGQYVKINTNALLRGRTKERFESYAKGRQWGWLSVNDIRALENMEPIEGGDVYLQPTNMIDVDSVDVTGEGSSSDDLAGALADLGIDISALAAGDA